MPRKLGCRLAPDGFRGFVSVSYSTFFYVTTAITQSHKKRERQLAFFSPPAPEAFTAPMTVASVVFSRSRSNATWADAKTCSSVVRMQYPTGQAAFGLRAGVANGSQSSTAR